MKDLFLHLGGLPIGKFYYELMYVENTQCFDRKKIRIEPMKNRLLLFSGPAHSELK